MLLFLSSWMAVPPYHAMLSQCDTVCRWALHPPFRCAVSPDDRMAALHAFPCPRTLCHWASNASVFGCRSNGSLLHMLCGSMYGGDDRRVANIVMSFNNKQVSDAVPIPGFLDNIGPVANALEGLGVR